MFATAVLCVRRRRPVLMPYIFTAIRMASSSQPSGPPPPSAPPSPSGSAPYRSENFSLEGHDGGLAEDDRARRACRREASHRLGLPDDASWEDINVADDARRRRAMSRRLGLPADSTWGDIVMANDVHRRREVAEMRGLPSDSSWADINAVQAWSERLEAVLDRGTIEEA